MRVNTCILRNGSRHGVFSGASLSIHLALPTSLAHDSMAFRRGSSSGTSIFQEMGVASISASITNQPTSRPFIVDACIGGLR